MKKFNYFLFLASITVMAVGCSDNIIEEDRFLKPSESEITFTSVEQSKSITIETDANNDFTASWQGDDWGKIDKEVGKLTIFVNANKGNEDRTTIVYVTLKKGGIIKEIKVTQNGAESSLGTLPEELFFSQLGGRKEITVFTNLSDWEVTSSTADWASVITDRTKGRITVDVLENTLDKENSLIITISSATAGLTKDIKVTQSAIQTYILPFLKFGATGPEIMAFEEARGSIYQTGRKPYMFKTLSEIITKMYYFTDAESYYLKSASSYYEGALFDKEIYSKLLEENEYEFMFTEPSTWGDIRHHWKESDKSLSSIIAFEEGMDFAIHFKQYDNKPNNPVQSDPIPTFPSYPLKFRTLPQPNYDEIMIWEAANGGVLQEDLSQERVLVFFTENDPAVAVRFYEMAGTHMLPGVTNITVVSRDMSLAMYPCIYTNIITNEFEEMLTSNNWERAPYSDPSTTYYYINTEENLRLQISSGPFKQIPELKDKEVISLTIIPLTAPKGFSSILSAQKALDSRPTPVFGEAKAISLSELHNNITQ